MLPRRAEQSRRRATPGRLGADEPRRRQAHGQRKYRFLSGILLVGDGFVIRLYGPSADRRWSLRDFPRGDSGCPGTPARSPRPDRILEPERHAIRNEAPVATPATSVSLELLIWITYPVGDET